MKLRPKQIDRLASLVMKHLNDSNLCTYKVDESRVNSKVAEVIKKNIADEMNLDREVNQMMDTLERQHPGEFERYKMFPMLKKKLAQEKGFVL